MKGADYGALMDIFYQHYFENGGDLKGFLDQVERHLLIRALSQSDGNQRKASELLSIKPTTLNAKCKKYGIKIVKEPSEPLSTGWEVQ